MTELLRASFRWQRHPGGRITGRLRRLAIDTLQRLGYQTGEVGVLLCDDASIQALNRRYRAKDRPTDVLSFPSGSSVPDGPPYIGDVAISVETAARQAEAGGHSLARELEVLLLHAVIHLAGHDHETDSGEMNALEARLRKELLS
ncbi:MAG: rRNA maturation RNase YbeY [Acidobacteriota bacterium]